MHLYLKEKVERIIKATKQLQTVLVHQAENNIETIMLAIHTYSVLSQFHLHIIFSLTFGC